MSQLSMMSTFLEVYKDDIGKLNAQQTFCIHSMAGFVFAMLDGFKEKNALPISA